MDHKEKSIEVIDRRVVFDYESDMPKTMYISALRMNKDSKLKYFLSKTYVCFVCFYLILISTMSSVVSVVVKDTKTKLEGLHWTCVHLIVAMIIPMRYTMLLDRPVQTIKAGFYRYENESPADYKRKEFHVWRGRTLNMMFYVACFAGDVVIHVLIKQVANNPVSDNEGSIKLEFAYPIYFPFDTKITVVYWIGYFMEALSLLYKNLLGEGFQQIFLSIMEQWIAQYEILNMSIMNIQEKAYAIYILEKNTTGNHAVDELYKLEEFQRCVTKCLRQNVIHHQILLRFGHDTRRFSESVFLPLVVLPVVFFAAMAIIILEMEDKSHVTYLMFLLISETLYMFLICYYGQMLSKESERMFFALWNTPWWNFDKKNRTMLQIMMANSLNPVILEARRVRTNMSLEGFGDMVARVYQMMSVLRKVR